MVKVSIKKNRGNKMTKLEMAQIIVTALYNAKEIISSDNVNVKRMAKHNIRKYPEFLVWNKLWGTTNYDVIPGVNVEEWLKYLKTM